MNILVMHDRDGNILSLGVPEQQASEEKIELIPETGQQVSEVELAGVTDNLTNKKTLQYLFSIVEQYRIELIGQKPELVRKEEKAMSTEASLARFASRLSETGLLRQGAILFSLSGADRENYFLDCSKGNARLSKGSPPHSPRIEVIGDARRIIAILEGRKDARKQFLAGGFRIRGDINYVSELALALELIQTPI